MTVFNDHGAQRMARILHHYGAAGTDRHCLIDLLADARHWCDRTGECFGDLDRTAHRHYLAELGDERRKP